jgi:nitrite reductase (NADH) small subunit
MDGGFGVSRWRDVGALEEIPSRGARVVATRAGDAAVFRTGDDAVFALFDLCPHKGGRLSQGIVHGTFVTCPLHNWVIALSDGRAREPDEGCARTVAVRVEGGRVLLALPA